MQQDRMTTFILRTLFCLCVLVWGYFALRFFLPATLPFWLGLMIACTLRPVILWISQRLHLKRRKAAAGVTILFYLMLGVGCWLGLSLLWSRLCTLAAQFPSLYRSIFLPALARFFEWLSELLSRFVPNLADTVHLWMQSFAAATARLSSSLSSKLLSACTGIATQIPVWFFSVVVTILCSTFISLDYPKVTAFLFRLLPPRLQKIPSALKSFVHCILLRLVRAYLILLCITFAELAVGLWLLGVKSFLSIAVVIALLDLLPVLGTGSVLIPWAVISLLSGQHQLGWGLLLLYLSITVIRNLLEPKIVGSCMGLHPLVSLISIYAGLRLFGPLGALLMPAAALGAVYFLKTRSEGKPSEPPSC